MITFLLSIFTVVLILISLFLIFVVLLQRADTNAGLGTAFGGGMAESTFGSDAGNVLTKSTRWAVAIFFLICIGLYLGYIRGAGKPNVAGGSLPLLQVSENAMEAAGMDGSSDAEVREQSAVELTASERPAVELSLPEDERYPLEETGEKNAGVGGDSATMSEESDQPDSLVEER